MESRFRKAVLDKSTPYLIAETAYIHEGNIEYLMNLIDRVIESKCCDAIKFHIMLDLDSYMVPSHKLYSSLSRFLFSEKDWIRILEKTKDNGIETIILADDVKALDFIEKDVDLIDGIEIHAIALNNIEMLEKTKTIPLPLIIGIGGSEIKDIEFAVKFLEKKDILLMHGFQNYPTRYEYINFRKIETVRKRFRLNVGYADHTSWDNENNELITLAGFITGANIIEKHVILSLGEERADYHAAVSTEMLSSLKSRMRMLDKTMGTGSLKITDYENIYALNGPMKFTVVAASDLKKGEVLSRDNITFRRTDAINTIKQREYLKLLGHKVKEDLPKFALVNWEVVER